MSMETVSQILVIVVILCIVSGGIALFVRWDNKRYEARRRVFMTKLRAIRDRATKEMRSAKTHSELEDIRTRANDEIEDLKL